MKFHDIYIMIYTVTFLATRYHVDVTAVHLITIYSSTVYGCEVQQWWEWESAESPSLTDSLHIYTWLLQAPPTLIKCSSYCILDAHLYSTRLLCLQMHAHIDVLVIITSGFTHFKFQLRSLIFLHEQSSDWHCPGWQGSVGGLTKKLPSFQPISSARQRNLLTSVLFLSQGLCTVEAVSTVVSSVELLRPISTSGCDPCVRLGSLVPMLPPQIVREAWHVRSFTIAQLWGLEQQWLYQVTYHPGVGSGG